MNGSGWSGVLRLTIFWHFLLAALILYEPRVAFYNPNTVQIYGVLGGHSYITGVILLISSTLGLTAIVIGKKHPLPAAFFLVPQQFILVASSVGWIETIFRPFDEPIPVRTAYAVIISVAIISWLICFLHTLSLLQSFGVVEFVHSKTQIKCRLIYRAVPFLRPRRKKVKVIVNGDTSSRD